MSYPRSNMFKFMLTEKQWLFYEEIFYMFAHLVIKQTFLMFYLRLTPNHRFRRFVYAVMILSAAFTLVNWLLAFLQCIPFDAIFHPELYPNATCMNKYVVLMTPSVLVSRLNPQPIFSCKTRDYDEVSRVMTNFMPSAEHRQ